MTTPPPGVSPRGTLLTVNPQAMMVDVVQLEDGSTQYWVKYLTPAMEYKFGPYTQEQWDGMLAVLADPAAAIAAADARAKIIHPGQTLQ